LEERIMGRPPPFRSKLRGRRKFNCGNRTRCLCSWLEYHQLWPYRPGNMEERNLEWPQSTDPYQQFPDPIPDHPCRRCLRCRLESDSRWRGNSWVLGKWGLERITGAIPLKTCRCELDFHPLRSVYKLLGSFSSGMTFTLFKVSTPTPTPPTPSTPPAPAAPGGWARPAYPPPATARPHRA